MSLQIKLDYNTVAKFATSITFQDLTGIYNSGTNPTGYNAGVPNYLDTPSTTGKAYIMWRYWSNTSFSAPIPLSNTQITALEGSGLILTPVALGLTTDVAGRFNDGVHQVKLLPAQTLAGSGTYTPGSKIVTLSGASNIAAMFGAKALVWVIGLDAGGSAKAYEIDVAGVNDNTQLTLKTAYLGTTVSSGPIVATADGDLKVFVNKAAENCIVSSTGRLVEQDGECGEAERTLNQLIRWRFSADVKFADLDFTGAHNLVTAINRICNSGKCICNL